jgi:hypothetical protein
MSASDRRDLSLLMRSSWIEAKSSLLRDFSVQSFASLICSTAMAAPEEAADVDSAASIDQQGLDTGSESGNAGLFGAFFFPLRGD